MEGGRFDHEPIVLYSEHSKFAKTIPYPSDSIRSPHVELRTTRSEVSKKCFMSYLILKTNSVDYHDGVHFVFICKL